MDPIVRAQDLALLQTASLFDLSTAEGGRASNAWLVDLFTRLVVAVRPKLVLELGAREATFSRSMRAALPEAEVHAFEANPYNYRRFSPKASAAGVEYHYQAIGEVVGPATFKVCTRKRGQEVSLTRGGNSLRVRAGGFEYEDASVQMTTVDRFVEQLDLVGETTAMWIDLEGCAYEALTGAERALRSTATLMVEVENAPIWEGQRLSGDVHALLHRAGFVAVARDFEYGAQYNVVFVNAEVYETYDVRAALVSAFSTPPLTSRSSPLISSGT